MKKIFCILSLFAALHAGAQTTIVLNNPNVCSGQSVTAIATATGYGTDTLNFAWLQNGVSFGAANNDTITLAPGVGTWNYTVNVTYGNQFIGTGFVTLTVNANPTATASNGGPYCQSNGPIQLQASGGTSYSWSGPNGFSSNAQNPSIIAVPLTSAGIYTVTVTNNNGCSASANTTVVVNPPPTPPTIGSNSPVCVGGTIVLTANGGNGVSYAWTGPNGFSSNAQNPILTNATLAMGGAYQVGITNVNGCSSGTGFNVTVNPKPMVIATGFNATCNGANNGSAIVNAFLGSPFTYAWTGGSNNDTITSLAPAVYSVTVTNVYGCSATDTATVGQPAVLTATISGQTNVLCNGGNNGTATVTPNGGTAPYNFSWTGIGSGVNPRTGLTAGTYTVTVTDANLCTSTATVTITQPAALIATANGGGIICNGGNNGTAVVAVTGGTPGYVYSWNNGGTTNTITGLISGTYIVTVTDTNNCSDTAGVTIGQPSQVSFTYTPVNVLCNGNNTGSITVTATGGVGNYQYKLNSNNWTTSNTFNGLIAGTYTVSVKDANGCTAGPTTIPITQANALQANANNTPQGCTYLGQAWASPSGGLGPYSFNWSNSLGSNDSIVAIAGTYTVTVTDANGCQSVDIAVIATPTPVNITGITTNPTCFGSNNGSINITVTGNAPFTYQWSNGATTQDIINLGSLNPYTVIATASNGCQGVWTDTLVMPTPLNISTNNDTTTCFGTNSGTLTSLATGGTGNYSFAWSPSGGNASIANGLNAGVYTVVVTDANGCTATNQGQVLNAPQLVVSSSVTNTQCAGSNTGAIDVTVTGGTGIPQYSWTGPSGFTQFNGDINSLAAGNYFLTVTDGNNCTATHSTIVNGPTNPIVAQFVNVQVPCTGQNNGSLTINASGGTPPFTYMWSNGDTTAVNNSLTPGNYTVTITDANGCVFGPMGQTLLGNPSMNIIIPAELTNYCVGSGVPQGPTISGGTYPYAVQWEDPNSILFATSEQIEPLLSGLYTLTVIDGSQCSQTMYVPVTLVTCSPSGINDLSSENIAIFPNPTKQGGTVLIQLPNTIHESISIELKSTIGQTLFQDKTSSEQYMLNLSSLAAGTYIVQIVSHNKSLTKRLVVQ